MLNVPDDEREARIQAGIAQDPDAPELTDQELAALRPVGRPKAAVTKEAVSIRLSPEVLAYFRSSGAGWQTRIDTVLREYVKVNR
jgi:uncharacterized protein (DUF4415 family)